MIKPIIFHSHKMTPEQNIPEVTCRVPYQRMYVQEQGNMYHCCTHWMPYSVGNIQDSSILSYYQSPEWNIVSKTFEDGSFKYCNADLCPSLQTYKTIGTWSSDLRPIHELEQIKNAKYLEVTLNYDTSCNLACPSCRNELQLVKNDPVLQSIHEKTLASITELLDNGYKVTMAVTSAGDPFASKLYIDALQNYHHVSENYDYFIVTNGTLLSQKKLEWDNIRHRTRGFAISVDAATKETYAKVRRFGDFDQLTANLKNLNEQKRNGFFTLDPYITVNFVISSLNFRELPLFMEQMLELEQISEIWLNLIADWGHLDNFDDYAIWRESHPDHAEFLAIMQHPLLKSNKLKATNAMRFIHG